MRILILEDDPLTALDIKGLVESAVEAQIIMCASVRSAKRHLEQRFDFAFLDIDVTDGKSFEIAELLFDAGVAFVFVSGSTPSTIPAKFRSVLFVAKPFSGQALVDALKAARVAGASIDIDAQAS